MHSLTRPSFLRSMLNDTIHSPPLLATLGITIKADSSSTWSLDPADTWDIQPLESPAEIQSDDSEDEDVDMHSPMDDAVLLVGLDDFEFSTSMSGVLERSGKLYAMIVATEATEARINLPLPWRELYLMYRSLQPQGSDSKYWDSADLNELIRATEMYLFYEFYDWNSFKLEEAILQRLEAGPDVHEPTSFDIADPLHVSKLRQVALKASMDKVVNYIDRNMPIDTEASQNQHDEERPRKWRKLTTK